MAFMRDHGVLKDIYTESDGPAHKTAKGSKVSVRTVKAPGFGPKGVLRYVLPYTVFLDASGRVVQVEAGAMTSEKDVADAAEQYLGAAG